uniref:Uncharacterized protein n=1 Tax=Oryza punctata TaxID=4537 RepID=A0A0E0L7A3_ORYPU
MSRKEVVAAAGGAGGAEAGAEGSSSAGVGGGGELAEALARRRLYREVTLALRTGLRDAKADFSFLRARGLRSLLGFLRSTASATDDSQLLLFRHSQSIPDLQVIPVLFQNSLHQPKEDPVVTLDHIFGVEPMKITSPPTDNEIALALRVLEGCCLLYSRCTALAHKYKAVKVILNILANRGPAEQGVCLDALISLMLDSPPNQMALARRRLYREVTLALRTGLRDAKADFSFLRARGLRSLLGFLRSTASATDDSQLLLFRHSQSIPDLQVIPVLFQNSLHQPKEDPVVTLDHIFGVEPMKITSPPTDNEIALALRVLEGCCLLYSRCTALAHKYKAVKVILNILANRGPAEQGVCLDALISLKCGEFLLLLIGHVYAKENSPIHEQMRILFGEQCASLIWAASRFGSTLDVEQRQMALQIQARRVHGVVLRRNMLVMSAA